MRIEKALKSICFMLGGTLLSASIVLNFGNVVSRYVFSHPIYWADEIVTFLMIWMVMLGMIVAVLDKSHLSIDLIFHLTKGTWLRSIGNVIGALSCVVLVYSASEIVYMKYSFSQLSISAKIPDWIPHSAILFGFLLSGALFIADLARQITAVVRRGQKND